MMDIDDVDTADVSSTTSSSGGSMPSGNDTAVDSESSSGAFSTSVFETTATIPSMRPNSDRGISGECHYFNYPAGWYAFIWYNFAGLFLFPLLIMTVCYGLIIHRIMASSMTSSSRADRDRRRITYMCIVLVSVFVLNWGWFHAVHIAKIDGIDETHEVCSVLTAVGSLLAFSNSALNPLLYIFLGTGFFRKWQSVMEAPSMRYVMTLKTRSTEFFSSNTRARTRTVDKSSSHIPSHDSGNKESSHIHSTNGSTKQTNGVTNSVTTKE